MVNHGDNYYPDHSIRGALLLIDYIWQNICISHQAKESCQVCRSINWLHYIPLRNSWSASPHKKDRKGIRRYRKRPFCWWEDGTTYRKDTQDIDSRPYFADRCLYADGNCNILLRQLHPIISDINDRHSNSGFPPNTSSDQKRLRRILCQF